MDTTSSTSHLRLRHPHALPVAELIVELNVDLAMGLSAAEVERRGRLFGRNVLSTRKPISDLRLFGRQFTSPVVALLAAAMALSMTFSEWQQAIAIAVVLAINTAIGYGTERRAVRSMEALRAMGGRNARVRRNGRSVVVSAEALVPGDVVLLDAGDIVPADLRCTSSAALGVDESALTGESVPVGKNPQADPAQAGLHERAAMLFKGTHVVRGSGEGVVVSTGLSTELGRITQLVQETDEGKSPLEQRLARLSRQLIWLTLILAAAVAAVGLFTGWPMLLMVETAVALAVAAIPEGLPIVATLALARGMLRMARRNALVEKLPAVETLGSTTMILTDKTGTLTENRMTVECVITPSGEYSFDYPDRAVLTAGEPVDLTEHAELERALLAAVLCGNAEYDPETDSGSGDPMEIALLRAGALAGMYRSEQLTLYPEEEEIPFDPSTKWMATVHRDRDRDQCFTALKGAPEAVLPLTDRIGVDSEPLDERAIAEWLDSARALASDGLRVLAVAVRPCADPHHPVGRGLSFAGLVAFRDPARADIREAIGSLHDAGIGVVMVTGDHPSTALSIAHDVGIATTDTISITGAELSTLEVELDRSTMARARVFARVSPEQKLDLIDLFHAEGEVVAMIGDGVNDAPALTKADIGVAMGKRGTDVAREAADIVLLDDQFSTIVTAVREGRIIFDNIRRFSMYLLSCNIAEVLVVGLAVVAGLPLPLMPLQILFLNLVTDVFPAFALATGEGEDDVLDRPPRPPGEPIISTGHWRMMAIYGLVISASTILALVIAQMGLGLHAAEATTVSFLTIALAQLWHVFNMRGRASGALRNAVTRNRFVWYALVLCLGLIVLAVTVPALAMALQIKAIGVQGWTLAIACSLLPLAVGQVFLAARSSYAADQRSTIAR